MAQSLTCRRSGPKVTLVGSRSRDSGVHLLAPDPPNFGGFVSHIYTHPSGLPSGVRQVMARDRDGPSLALSRPMARQKHHETWLWIQHLDAHLARLSGHLSSFPALPGLRAGCFFDPRSTAVLVRLRFVGASTQSEALRSWAMDAGLELVETSSWSPRRTEEFSTAVERYRCTGNESPTATAIVSFVSQLLRASAGQMTNALAMLPTPPLPLRRPGTSDGVPRSVEICDSFKVEVMRHTTHAPGPKLDP